MDHHSLERKERKSCMLLKLQAIIKLMCLIWHHKTYKDFTYKDFTYNGFAYNRFYL